MTLKQFIAGFFILCSIISYSKSINESQAKSVAQNFLVGTSSASRSSSSFELVYKSKSAKSSSNSSLAELTYFYIFNAGSDGYVIVSGDDNVIPILGYSDEVSFDGENIPEHVAKWLGMYRSEIQNNINKDVSQSEEVAGRWKRLINGESNNSNKKTQAVNPLVKTKWGQKPYVNDQCPGGSVSGCVATGMAQILKYWNYPETGSGFHSYNHKTYGTLSANFGNTTYNWTSMPNVVSSANSAVATLMYHLGVSVDMNYTPKSSGAYVIAAGSPTTNNSEYALKNYFGYENIAGVQKSNYTEASWMTMLKGEFNAGRPVLYAGYGTGGGHCFVADGFDANNFIHFNWGWGGSYDGFFAIGALNPTGVGTGGGSGGYNSSHQAVIGIEPPAGKQTFDLDLYAAITPSATSIGYGNPFTITTNFENKGGNPFNGDFCAAIFDASNNFVGYVDSLVGFNLNGGNHYINNQVFSSAGSFSMLPGTYSIGIYYRPIGGKWKQMGSGAYANPVQINVVNTNDISLYAALGVSPGTTLTKGEAASVSFNVKNSGASTFYGDYSAGLYTLEGKWVQTIGTISEVSGLASGNVYVNPNVLSTVAITADPGSYLIALQHSPNNAGYELTGTGAYANPIKVNVVAPPLVADIYEVNETVGQAYTLSFPVINYEANVVTTGSNVHQNTDNDFYKINLPSGYNYLVSARINDSYNSSDGNTYTLDCLFSYSTDGGVSWSDTYDDVMPNDFNVLGGGEVYFKVAPFFAGNTGTYVLTLYTYQSSVVSVDNNNPSEFTLYPNPSAKNVTISTTNGTTINAVDVINTHGKTVLIVNIQNSKNIVDFSVEGLANGIYNARVKTNKGETMKKFVVLK